jgi:hypothetical protein
VLTLSIGSIPFDWFDVVSFVHYSMIGQSYDIRFVIFSAGNKSGEGRNAPNAAQGMSRTNQKDHE